MNFSSFFISKNEFGSVVHSLGAHFTYFLQECKRYWRVCYWPTNRFCRPFVCCPFHIFPARVQKMVEHLLLTHKSVLSSIRWLIISRISRKSARNGGASVTDLQAGSVVHSLVAHFTYFPQECKRLWSVCYWPTSMEGSPAATVGFESLWCAASVVTLFVSTRPYIC